MMQTAWKTCSLCLALMTTTALPYRVRAQQATCPASNLIHTHAMAHTRLSNTLADGSVAISADGQTAAAVTRELGTRSQTLIGFLREQHADRLVTDQISVTPKIHTVKGGPDQIVGYTGRINVSFRTTFDRVSELITGALQNGANTLEQVSFLPGEDEVASARRTLAIEATRTAMAQAEAVAKAAGEHVVSVRDISVDPEGNTLRVLDSVSRNAAMSFATQSPAAPVATAAGEQDVSITVNLDVNIAQ